MYQVSLEVIGSKSCRRNHSHLQYSWAAGRMFISPLSTLISSIPRGSHITHPEVGEGALGSSSVNPAEIFYTRDMATSQSFGSQKTICKTETCFSCPCFLPDGFLRRWQQKSITQHCRVCPRRMLHWDDFISVWACFYYTDNTGTSSLWFSLNGFLSSHPKMREENSSEALLK